MKQSKRLRHRTGERGFQETGGERVSDDRAIVTRIFDDIDERVYVADPESHEILYANRCIKRDFGEDLVGKKCHEVLRGSEKPCDLCTNRFIFGENLGKSYTWEVQNQRNKRWYRCTDKAIRWDDGRMVRYQMAVNIHERKLAEEALRESEEKYRRLVENIHEVIYSVDKAGFFTYISPSVLSMTGYSPSEIVGLHFSNFVHQDDLERVAMRYEAVLSGQEEPTEYRILTKSGEARWVRTFSRSVCQGNEAIGLQGVLADITDYKEAQLALKASEERYRELLETMNEGFTMTDDNGVRTYANKKACEMFGYGLQEMTGQPVWEFLDNSNKRKWKEEFEKRREGDSTPYEIRWTRKDGKEVNARVSPRPVFDEKGDFKGSFSVITDITAFRAVEAALREREEELNLMTTDLAEINTALRVLLQRREKDKEELEEKILLNLKDLVNPYLDKLRKSIRDRNQKTYLDILESNLRDLTSSFSRDLHLKYLNLTPRELHITSLIREGKTSKDIADFMNLSIRTIETHRKSIRKKMGVTAKKNNLRTVLLEAKQAE